MYQSEKIGKSRKNCGEEQKRDLKLLQNNEKIEGVCVGAYNKSLELIIGQVTIIAYAPCTPNSLAQRQAQKKMKLKIVEDVAKHLFAKLLMEDMNEKLEEVYPESIENFKSKSQLTKYISKLNDPEWYRLDVFIKVSALTTVLDKTVYAHAFIQKFPSS